MSALSASQWELCQSYLDGPDQNSNISTDANTHLNVQSVPYRKHFNLLKPTGHVMHHEFNIQQLYALPTLYLCVLYLSENKQRLVPLTA